MERNQMRAEGVYPLVIRALGVLAITLMAMTASPTGSTAATDCSSCPTIAHASCFLEGCDDRDDSACAPLNVPIACFECGYTWQCTEWNCALDEGGPKTGTRVECVLETIT